MKPGFNPINEPNDSFELTPMIDVVFLLIAFFMTVTNMISANLVEIEVPDASEAKVPEQQINRQFITVDGQGTVYFGSTEVYDMRDVTEKIAALHAENPDLKVYIRGDAGVAHREINRVMQAVSDGGVFDVIFATEQN